MATVHSIVDHCSAFIQKIIERASKCDPRMLNQLPVAEFFVTDQHNKSESYKSSYIVWVNCNKKALNFNQNRRQSINRNRDFFLSFQYVKRNGR